MLVCGSRYYTDKCATDLGYPAASVPNWYPGEREIPSILWLVLGAGRSRSQAVLVCEVHAER